MSGIPAGIRALVARREDARTARDFSLADELRDEIRAAGFVITDTPEGPVLDPAPAFEPVDPASISSELTEEPSLEVSVHLLYEGFREDLERFLRGLERHCDLARTEVVVVDNASDDGAWLESLAHAHGSVRVVHLSHEEGWAAARNAGLKGAKGRILVMADLSIEPTGDVLTPVVDAFEDPTVGIAGPFGLVSENMRLWAEAPGPEVDAIEGYLLATRREALADELVNEKFKWYRNADIDLSFQVRSAGFRAVVVPLPVAKHIHRGWAALDEEERAKRSKRNHYLFFDRWKHHDELLLSHQSDQKDE